MLLAIRIGGSSGFDLLRNLGRLTSILDLTKSYVFLVSYPRFFTT